MNPKPTSYVLAALGFLPVFAFAVTPILASIRMSLAAIETSLRDLVQSQGGDPNSESASNRRKSSG